MICLCTPPPQKKKTQNKKEKKEEKTQKKNQQTMERPDNKIIIYYVSNIAYLGLLRPAQGWIQDLATEGFWQRGGARYMLNHLWCAVGPLHLENFKFWSQLGGGGLSPQSAPLDPPLQSGSTGTGSFYVHMISVQSPPQTAAGGGEGGGEAAPPGPAGPPRAAREATPLTGPNTTSGGGDHTKSSTPTTGTSGDGVSNGRTAPSLSPARLNGPCPASPRPAARGIIHTGRPAHLAPAELGPGINLPSVDMPSGSRATWPDRPPPSAASQTPLLGGQHLWQAARRPLEARTKDNGHV